MQQIKVPTYHLCLQQIGYDTHPSFAHLQQFAPHTSPQNLQQFQTHTHPLIAKAEKRSRPFAPISDRKIAKCQKMVVKNGIKWQNITIAHNAPKTRHNAI
jgi:hypothetical protein